MSKERSHDQTATAFSLDKELYEAMERHRKRLGLPRSAFIRMCVAKEIDSMAHSGSGGIIATDAKGDYKVNNGRKQKL
jgi:predicted DNA-binding protein